MPRYWSRRELFNRCGGGIGSLALANILAAQDNPLALKKPHFPAKIKSVISIFCYGGVSHIDTFDPKPLLLKRQGEALPEKDLKPSQGTPGAIMASPWTFKKY